jgi:hypothetical protein
VDLEPELMARRRARKRWQKVITRLFVAVITDVRADLKRGHATASTARAREASRRGAAPMPYGSGNTAYAPVRDQALPGQGDARYARQQRNNARLAEQWKIRADIADSGTTSNEYAALSPEQRQQYVRRAGLCGAKCKDGTPCLNRGRCPVPGHRRGKGTS